MANKMILNGTSYFGRGSRSNLAGEIETRGFKKIMIVTDKNLVDTGTVNLITSTLDSHNLAYSIYSDIKSNPTIKNVVDGYNFWNSIQADVIVAIGGGSVIDTAKAIGIIITNPEYANVVSLDGVVSTKNESLPIIALPTTAGTASEVTINYVITDPEQTKKMVCIDSHVIPIVAIIDPELMDEMPKDLAAATGMDALTHAMEGYLNRSSWLMSDMFHINAMALIYKNLEKAVLEKDKQAIDDVAYGQYIAGMGFSNSGLGIVHSMAHSLGAYYDIPHGLANAMLLPYVLAFNGEICPDLFKNIGHAILVDIDNIDDKEVIKRVVEAISNLNKKLNIPQSLKEIGIKPEDLEKLAHQAINDICTPGNIRDVSEADILNIYQKAYEGKKGE